MGSTSNLGRSAWKLELETSVLSRLRLIGMTEASPASVEERDSPSEPLGVTPGTDPGEGGSTSQEGNLLGETWLTSVDRGASVATTSGTMLEARGLAGVVSCGGEGLA